MFAEVYLICTVTALLLNYSFYYCCYKPKLITPEEVKDKTCSICLEDLCNVEYVTKTSCNHYFCSKCLYEWLKIKHHCPLCMTEFI